MEAELKALLEKAKLEYEQELAVTEQNVKTYEDALAREQQHLEKLKLGFEETSRLLAE